MDSISKLKEKELGVLEYIDTFCIKNKINYFLNFGTLLGSIRHEGFIPWDDDIDICMLNKDYKKFCSIYKNSQNKPYFLQIYKTEKKIPFTFAKIRIDGTKFISAAHESLKIHQGIFIDIFPLYKLPLGTSEKKRQLKRIKFWRQLFISKSISVIDREIKRWNDYLLLCIRKILFFFLLPVPKEYIYNRLIKTLEKFEYLDNNNCLFYEINSHDSVLMTYDDIFPLMKGKFENKQFFIPKNYDKILSLNYGNYMDIPSKEKQVTHRPIILELE